MSTLLKLIIPILIIVAVGLYFFVFTGVIKVDSSRPPGATVQIDGIVIGTTPIAQRMRVGVYQIKIYKEGFETWQGEEKVSASSASVISVKLRFLLRSEPTDAQVIINDEYIGVTDLAIDLKPGVYTFEFKKDEYQDAKFRANIPKNADEAFPVVTLTPAEAIQPEKKWLMAKPSPPGYGNIQVTSKPDAQVYLDGEWQGETPLTIRKVTVGSYVITLSKDGYMDMRKTVYIKKDETTKFAGELKPESIDE